MLGARMATHIPCSAFFRTRGELLKVGHRVAATTIRSVLLATGVPPYGQRSQLTWKQFLAAHAETLAAADFFSVDTIFFKRLYVLIYVHLASRRVWGSINTSNSSPAHISGRSPRTDRIPGRVIGSLFYSLLRVLLDALATKYGRHAELQAEVLALRRQVQVLERQIKRVHWSPGDRMVLAALRDRIPRSGWAGLLVKPETVLGWHRALVRRKWAAYGVRPRRGRPQISTECRQLIVRMARENPRWGYFRIRGELLKVGHQVAATTIRSVLLAAGVPPSGRRSQLTWRQFLSAHAESLVAADFFSVDTIFFRRLYVLIYVHLASRRVLLASSTSEPYAAWLTQQARNLSWRLEDEGINLGVLIHDRCKKFAPQADRVFQSQGCLSDPDSTDGAEGQCACRALDRELPPRMPRLDACRQPAPPGDGHQRIF